MNFRYNTQHLTRQQNAIINHREENERIHREESERIRKENELKEQEESKTKLEK